MAIDLLIKRGLIVDGTGGPSYTGDVAIRDGRLAALGKVTESASRVIDADGLAVAPGFWDLHTHYDAQLLWDPLATSSCWHGVTSVVMGNCGYTVAPCKTSDQEFLIRLLARVEGIPASVVETTLPWRWESFAQYLDMLEGRIGVNTAPQVGHSAVRRYVMGQDASERAATPEEVQMMKRVVAESLKAGGFSLTTSRTQGHWDGDGKPVPTRLATMDEYRELLRCMRGLSVGYVELAGGYQYDNGTESGRQLYLALSEVAGKPVCMFPVSASLDRGDTWRATLARLHELRQQGHRLFAQVFVQPDDFEFRFESTDVFNGWPAWQKAMIEPKARKIALMRDQATRELLKEQMLKPSPRRIPVDWASIILVHSPTGRYKQLEGRTLVDIGREQGKHPQDVAFDMSLEEDLRTHFRLLDWRYKNEAALAEIINSPEVIPGLSDAGAHLVTEVTTGFPTRLVGYWVREKRTLTLEAAVRKLTSMPAEAVGVTDRGLLKEGMAADVTVFDPRTVDCLDREFVADMPGGADRLVQRAKGIEYTIVNGKVTLEHGKASGDLGGKVLRSHAYSAVPE